MMTAWQIVVLVAIVAFVVLEVVGMITKTLQAKYPQITEDTIYRSILGAMQSAADKGGEVRIRYGHGDILVMWDNSDWEETLKNGVGGEASG